MEVFRTRRLVGERLRPEHVAELVRMHADARVMATLGGIRSEDETRSFLRRNLDHWDEHGFGLWMFRRRAGGGVVGRGGLRQVEIEGVLEIELNYAVAAELWRRGFATEMAEGIVSIGFRRLALKDIVAFTQPTNRSSRRVLEKAGFAFEREFRHAGLPHVLYRRQGAAQA